VNVPYKLIVTQGIENVKKNKKINGSDHYFNMKDDVNI